MIYLYVIGLAILSAVAYRVSGHGGFKSAKLIRRLGCPLTILVSFWILKGFVLADYGWYLLTYALSYAAISTYNDWITGGHEDWRCWIVTGALYSLSAFPLCIITGLWLGFIVRTIFLSFGIMFLRENTDSVTIEETGSGFLYTISVLLLTF